jgi:hypothetical protein
MSTGMRLSRRALVGVAGGLAAGVMAACSTLNVNTDWNTTIDFTQDTLPYSTFTQERLRSDIAATLSSKGLSRDERDPQLIVIYRINLSSQTQYTTVNSGGYGYGPAWGGWGYGGVGVSTTTQHQIPYGALTIAIVDPKLNQLVWRGEADAELSDSQSNAQMAQEAIQRMFAQFPPKKGEMPGNTNF